MDLRFEVIPAHVLSKTERVVTIRPLEGPRAGEAIPVPISIFEEIEFVDLTDDEVVIQNWYAAKHNIITIPTVDPV